MSATGIPANPPPPSCDHNFQFQGTVAWHDGRMPGSGAEYRYYAERFFCTRCLAFRYTDVRQDGNSYRELKYNAIALEKAPV